MGRKAREYSPTGLYHIVFRGISRQNIFEEDNDYRRMLNIISVIKKEMMFKIYAYCLMTNHVHILLKESSIGDISIVMQRLLTRYAGWFNRKYERSGILVSNRYKSQPIENDEYLLSVVRYIHQNPLRANMVTTIDDYRWSSYSEYINAKLITDTEMILSMVDKKEFVEFHQQEETELYEVNDRIAKSEEYVRRRVIELLNGINPCEIGMLPKPERDMIIKRLREAEGFSIRQIERATGISRGIIAKVDK